jgi:hypothetical protein
MSGSKGVLVDVLDRVIGRDQERTRIESFLVGPRPAALLIEGEAGIGKTMLWSLALETAASRGERTLSWRASAAERDLAFSTLNGLLDLPELQDALPAIEPRRRAIEVALARVEPGDGHPTRA